MAQITRNYVVDLYRVLPTAVASDRQRTLQNALLTRILALCQF